MNGDRRLLLEYNQSPPICQEREVFAYMALPIQQRPADCRDNRNHLARAIERMWETGRIRDRSPLHMKAIRFHHGLIGEHDLLTDLRLHFFLNPDGSQDIVLVETAALLYEKSNIPQDILPMVIWLATHGGKREQATDAGTTASQGTAAAVS